MTHFADDATLAHCYTCGVEYGGREWPCDLVVANDVWDAIRPDGAVADGGLLCPSCMVRRVSEAADAGRLSSCCDVPCAINGMPAGGLGPRYSRLAALEAVAEAAELFLAKRTTETTFALRAALARLRALDVPKEPRDAD